jgi:hypothetical protein
MTALEARIVRLELALSFAQTQIATLSGQTANLAGQARQATGVGSYSPGTDSGTGGTAAAFICQAIPAIAGGASGTADVYQRISGAETLVVTAATIWNSYASATTAGRRCTLCRNPDGSFTVYGQSCT